MQTTQAERGARFRALHARAGAFVIPNPWDAGTARILTSLGFEALTTTSAGLGGAGSTRISVADLAAVGVRRISVGSALSRAALGCFIRAAREIRDDGTFTFVTSVPRFDELDAFMSEG